MDVVKESIDVRSTIIYDLQGWDRIIVAQTRPPILRSAAGQRIEGSFVYYDREFGRRRRFGFPTQIVEVLNNYEIRAGVYESAVSVLYPTKGLRETSVRLHYRVEPTAEHELSISLLGDAAPTHIIDISLGGVLVSYGGHKEYRGGQTVRVILQSRNQEIRLQGEVVRTFDREGSKLVFLAVRFIEMEQNVARQVQQVVSQIMRDELRSRSGLKEQVEPLATPRGLG